MPEAVPSLDLVMKKIRDQAKAALIAAGITPEQDFIYTGPPPHDTCKQLVVYLDNLNQTQTNPLGGLSGNRAVNRFAQIPAGDFIIEWTSCSPAFGDGGGDPSAADYEAASTTAAQGISAIYSAFVTHIRDGTLLDGLVIDKAGAPPNCRIGLLEPGGVSGWVAWYRLTVTVVYA